MKNRLKNMLSAIFILLVYIVSVCIDFSPFTMVANAVEERYDYSGKSMGRLTDIYFDNDTKSMASKLSSFLDIIYKEMTHTDYTDGSIIKHMPTVSINNKLCIEVPLSVKIIKPDGSVLDGFSDFSALFDLSIGDTIRINMINSSNRPSTYTINTVDSVDRLRSGIADFIIRVRQEMMKGLISQSIVVMRSSTKTVGRLSDIMEKDEETQAYDFTAKFKAYMQFTPMYILHPIVGKIENVNSFLSDCDGLRYTGFYKGSDDKIYKSKQVSFFSTEIERKDEVKDKLEADIMGVPIHSDYKILLDKPLEYLKNYNAIDSKTTAFDFSTFPCQYSRLCYDNETVKVAPNYFMSYIYPLAIPDNYTKSGGNAQIYRMQNYSSDAAKYLCIENIAINVKTSTVYSYDGSIYTKIGDFAEFDLQRDDIYIHTSLKPNCTYEQFDSLKSEEDKDSLRIGVAVCGKLYEGVWDTTENENVQKTTETGLVITEVNKEGGLYLTGRKVVIGANYPTEMPFNILTSSTLQLDENGSMFKTCAKFYAFAHDVTSAKYRDQHKKTLDSSIRFQAYFLNIPPTNGEKGLYGICLVRNNFYATDTSLVNWLTSDAAKGISYVKADDLLKLLTSSSTAENNILSYDDFNKMEAIREKLEHYHDNDIYSFVHQAIIIIGFLVVFYGALLLLAFFFDLFDIGTNINLLGKLSFGKLKACSISDYEYVAQSTDYVYVTWKKILIRVIACFFVGLLLVEYETLMTYIIFIYQYFMDLAGIT